MKEKRDRKRQKGAFESQERDARQQRIQKERDSMQPVMFEAYDKIGEFRNNIRTFKQDTVELSKKFIVELEDAAKADRLAWMERSKQFD